MRPSIIFPPGLLKIAVAISLLAGAVNGWGAATDLANGPLANGVSAATTVKPNIAFIVDDSGSMDDQNMPDDEGTNKNKKCWGHYKYNTLAYNPATTYKPPYKPGGAVYSDGITRYPDATFAAALKDGYFSNPGYTYGGNSTSNGVLDLSSTSNLPTTYSPKYYYATTSNTSSGCLNDTDYTSITASASITAPSGVNALTNYANWYSYYRKRAYLMKASAAEAFRDLSDQYRLGLFFINSIESGAGAVNNDLGIDDFTGGQRTTWFSRLLGARKDSGTPLLGALSRAGRMYAGKITGWDPVQYSCQQNFTILSTDGYWNDIGGVTGYGPYAINGTSNVGNVDGGAVAATSATASITWSAQSGTGSNGCYRFTSITVNTGSGNVQLLDSTPVPTTCTTDGDSLGNAVAASINNLTATTGFTATFDGGPNTLTISAPASLGDLTVMPAYNYERVSGGKNRTFSSTAFTGYTAGATTGAPLPYKDNLNASNTLADIAYYYYTTDLRTSSLGNCSNTIGSTTFNNLCDNNVLGSGKDTNQQQHMTTFTLGLGVSGTIFYESNYETAADISGTTQYYDIKNETANWPDPYSSTSQEKKRIDDLWHAAVNGRGTYYSASNAQTLEDGIRSALAGVTARIGSSSAAATSNLEPVAGDNYVYVALYRTVVWDGDLKAYTIDPDTGAISASSVWSAQSQLDSTVTAAATASAGTDGRTIKYFKSTATNKLNDFTFTNLTTDGLSTNFSDFCSKNPAPDQCGSDADDLTATQKSTSNAGSGDNLVKYLRGQATYEDENSNTNPFYRSRDHVLGDIINAVPVFMKKPPFGYDQYDTTYTTYKNNNATRGGTVFVAANDGMLHAINSDNGNERWAYVPSFVMPNLWKLADRAYGNNHQYLVDGSPTVADICSSSSSTGCAAATNWKTIVVAGLNKGGCGYYALDVTDPTSPKGLWEFSNVNLGYSYGNPIITRRPDGQWVVIVASGYNNIPNNGCASSGASSDGNGHIFVLDAITGAVIDDVVTYTSGTTLAGSATTPSGLAKLNAWVDSSSLNITSSVYGGDLLGNVWRFDFDGSSRLGNGVLLAKLVTSTGLAQPVTTKPELAEVTYGGAHYKAVFVATGKYLGTTDPSDTSQQSIYGLKDTAISDVRGTTMVERTLTQVTSSSGQTIRKATGSAIDWSQKQGWYMDLNPGANSPGERVNTDMQLQYNILTVAANVPDTNVCDIGGYGWLYFIDIDTGLNLSTSVDGMAGVRLAGNALIAGIKTVKLANGKTVTIVTDTGGGITVESNPSPTGEAAGAARRTTWREIQD